MGITLLLKLNMPYQNITALDYIWWNVIGSLAS